MKLVTLTLLLLIHPSVMADEATAVFAGGCFWCMEPPFDKLKGVSKTTSGYTGGRTKNPTYKDVSRGDTGHVEVIEVRYDPQLVSYQTLLEVYWRNVDPFDLNGQFCDKGESYRPEIFYNSQRQKKLAQQSLQALNASGRFDEKIAVPVTAAATFYKAETYHQDYYQKNPVRYNYYRWGCGRDKRLKQVWYEEAGGKHLSSEVYKSELE